MVNIGRRGLLWTLGLGILIIGTGGMLLAASLLYIALIRFGGG